MVILATNKNSDLAIVQSSIHDFWAWDKCSTMGGSGLRYSPTDAFETFPFPTLTPETEKELETIGEKYYNQRQQIMREILQPATADHANHPTRTHQNL